MARFIWDIIWFLAAWQPVCAQTAVMTTDTSLMLTAIPSTSLPTSTFIATLPTFEIDIVFPRVNETYNYSTSLPIVFAFQNLSAAAELGTFKFRWTIVPYHSIYMPIPGGIKEDFWEIEVTANNVSTFTNDDGSPYILVNNTNPSDWRPPNYGGTAYALQWYIRWDTLEDQCDSYPTRIFDRLLFTMLPGSVFRDKWEAPNPSELQNVTGQCSQLGSLGEVNVGNAVCESFRQLEDIGYAGNPCAIRGDDAMVSSISNAADSLVTAQSLATMTTSSSSSTNVAVRTGVPVRPAYAAAAIFGGLELLALR